MLSKKLQNELNAQINLEFFSEYSYLSMTAYFESINLDGFSNFFRVQASEEHFHAMKIFDFINTIGGKVNLETINKPVVEFDSILNVFETALAQENRVSESINHLMDTAIQENNHAVISFLKWYVDEQVEEIDLFTNLIAKLKLINNDGNGILLMNSELAKRKAAPEITNTSSE
ncbi:MAG: Ferritin-like protein [Chlorobi bacterium OLB4]|jgi:Ferritin-like protein|nr:MAG: Ferritin-like protein [Chlorobi bacterium OLB4]MBW7855592.1 ferritin [Ignavibacteria bacterium]OQY79074.1 MAG: hypothetical protein B6D43_00310 [Ignavibacteriales bacterium UTCHB1]